MDKRELSKLVRAAGRMLLALGFVFSQTAWAAQNQGPQNKADGNGKAQQQTQANAPRVAPTKVQPAEEEETAPQNNVASESSHRGGQGEGIKIHGHWTIEVRDPDGTVVTHRDFENSLVTTGADALSSILSQSATMGFWEIQVGLSGPCSNANGSPSGCFIYPSAYPVPAGSTNIFSTLTIANPNGTIVLNGSAVAGQSGNVANVYTSVVLCPPSVAPSSGCGPTTYNQGNPFAALSFTAATLQTPVPVTTGQTIAVTVNLTFS